METVLDEPKFVDGQHIEFCQDWRAMLTDVIEHHFGGMYSWWKFMELRSADNGNTCIVKTFPGRIT